MLKTSVGEHFFSFTQKTDQKSIKNQTCRTDNGIGVTEILSIYKRFWDNLNKQGPLKDPRPQHHLLEPESNSVCTIKAYRTVVELGCKEACRFTAIVSRIKQLKYFIIVSCMF